MGREYSFGRGTRSGGGCRVLLYECTSTLRGGLRLVEVQFSYVIAVLLHLKNSDKQRAGEKGRPERGAPTADTERGHQPYHGRSQASGTRQGREQGVDSAWGLQEGPSPPPAQP